MPFSDTHSKSKEKWAKTYDNVFKPIIEGCGYVCKRSELENGSFTKKIVRELKDSFIVLADITDFNSNVMWELGVRHALSKRTIMVALSGFISQIPSDIKNYGVIPYEQDVTEYKDFKEKIENLLKKNATNPEESDSPVFDTLSEEELIRSDIVKKQVIGNLTGLTSELLYDLNFAEDIINGQAGLTEQNTTLYTFKTESMNHLVSTNYVYADPDYYDLIRTTARLAAKVNRRLDLYLLDKRFKQNRHHDDEIKNESKILIDKIKTALTQNKKLISAIKKNQLNESKPPIIYYKDEHQPLFEE